MKVVHVVGNRPQFIKLAPVYHALRRIGIDSTIIHSGQHFDENMSEQFFDEFKLPSNYLKLDCTGSSHGEMTGEIITKVERCLLKISPRIVLVYGDTNTTLAAALASAKLRIPLVHVEAGPRLGSFDTPEEINRVVVDRISDFLISPDVNSTKNLKIEGRKKHEIYEFGDVVYDAFQLIEEKKPTSIDDNVDDFVLATFHRPQNVDTKQSLENMYEVLNGLNKIVIFPMHPRTKNSIEKHGLMDKFYRFDKLTILKPLGFSEMKWLIKRCSFVVTDSGGVQREAYFGGKQAKIAIPKGPWPSLEASGWITPINWFSSNSVLDIEQWNLASATTHPIDDFGGGKAASKLALLIQKVIHEN